MGRSACMPSERRWARDGPSARARTTVPERRNPWEPGAVRQRQMVSPLCRNKGGRPPGRNQISAALTIWLMPHDSQTQTPDSRKGSLSSPLNYCMLFFIIGRPIVVFGGRTLVAVFERSPFGIKSKRIFLSADAAFILLSKQ